MKILNLYSGIGGNRKNWDEVLKDYDYEITAVEYDPKIAKIYQDFFPNDKVIIGDAHQYLLDHFQEFDFIWSSPPCPTHSRMNFLSNVQEGKKVKYPDMELYQEIIFLRTWFKGKWCIENVISYYEPLIEPQISDNHYFWTNFHITPANRKTRGIKSQYEDYRKKMIGFDFTGIEIIKTLKKKVINNCVEPETGKRILEEFLKPVNKLF